MATGNICFAPSTFLLGIAVLVAVVITSLTMCRRYYPVAIPSVGPSQSTPPNPEPVAASPVAPPTSPPTPPFIIIPPPPKPVFTDPVHVTLVPLPSAPTTPNVSSFDTQYRELGYVQATDSPTRLVMSLFGRRKFPRSEKYEYYVVDANQIKIPFSQKNDAEIWDKDAVSIPGFTYAFVAKMYPHDEIPYNPYI